MLVYGVLNYSFSLLCVDYLLVNPHNVFIHPAEDGQSFEAIMNGADMNILIYVFW